MRVHPYHSESREPAARGEALGSRWSAAVSGAVGSYRRHFRALGIADDTVATVSDACFAALSSWSPALADEIAGIGRGAGVRVRDVAMLNARTEILAAVAPAGDGECSTVVRVPPAAGSDTRAVAFQTWDWHAALAPDGLMWRYEPAPGHWVKTFTEPGMLAKIGINSRGLAVHFNILHHRDDGPAGGVPVHAVARRMLDEAQTVDEAHRIAASARTSASTVLTVLATGTGAPEAASIELSPAGTALVPPGPDGWLLHTNHFLAPRLLPGGVLPARSTSERRYEHLERVRPDGLAGADLPSLARQLCGSEGATAPLCVTEDPALRPADRVSTLLTVLLDPVGGTIEYWPGTPHQAGMADHARRF